MATVGHILHSEGRDRSRRLLKKIWNALAPGGTIAIQEFVPNDERTGPLHTLIFAVNMLVNTDEGNTFTFAEMSAWLREAGYVNPACWMCPRFLRWFWLTSHVPRAVRCLGSSRNRGVVTPRGPKSTQISLCKPISNRQERARLFLKLPDAADSCAESFLGIPSNYLHTQRMKKTKTWIITGASQASVWKLAKPS